MSSERVIAIIFQDLICKNVHPWKKTKKTPALTNTIRIRRLPQTRAPIDTIQLELTQATRVQIGSRARYYLFIDAPQIDKRSRGELRFEFLSCAMCQNQ